MRDSTYKRCYSTDKNGVLGKVVYIENGKRFPVYYRTHPSQDTPAQRKFALFYFTVALLSILWLSIDYASKVHNYENTLQKCSSDTVQKSAQLAPTP